MTVADSATVEVFLGVLDASAKWVTDFWSISVAGGDEGNAAPADHRTG
jgi:hypothetical protein